MDVMYEVVCGLDVHKETIVACVIESAGGRKTKQEVRTFCAHTRDLYQLRSWLLEKKVEAVAMEGTGIYWRPVYAILEEGTPWKLVVGNALHVKNVPGRKTDVKDAEWLASLVQVGLIRPSFVPPPAIRELRDLTRQRKKMVNDRTRMECRVLKVLQAANIKLDGVATDAFGVSGMAIMRSLAKGDATPKQMAQLAKGRLKKKVDALEVALEGKLGLVHRQMLAIALDCLDQADAALKRIDELIDAQVSPHSEAVERLKTIPGVDRVVAVSMIAELGPDMSVFPTVDHCASWAGVCPGNNQSAGKSRDGRPQRGNVHLKTMLCQAAQSAARKKDTYFHDKFYRLKARRGHNKAIMAIAHKQLIAAYYMLKNRTVFIDLGPKYLDGRDRLRVARTLAKRLQALDFVVTLQDAMIS